jgi:hypothetical protein
VDEKPVVLHQEIRVALAMKPGCVGRRAALWNRQCVLPGSRPKAGRHFTKVTARRSAPEFAAARYSQADTIHLVMDNLSSHTRKSVMERFGEKAGWLWNRFTVHYTPKHGSWLNQAEIAIGQFSRQCLAQRRIADRASLGKALEPPYESRPRSNPVGIYSQECSQYLWLHNNAVTVQSVVHRVSTATLR